MLESGDTLGRYRIVNLIGSGGMGEVYLAEDTELQRRVAVKLFTRGVDKGAARDHLLHEARAASALSHPNVCTVFEVGEDDGRPYIVMEYVEGRTLDALIAGRDLPPERVVRYGSQIADAVAHAHDHAVIHRDLKSANIVITHDGRAKVLDFGLASTVAGGADSATREVTSAEAGRMSGTLSYMSPEVLRGQEADPRSDIWALGVVLYEAATGHLPFRGDTAFEVSTAIMKESAEVPAETSPGLKVVIQRCLQKAPGERYQSAAEVRAALEMLQSGGSTSDQAIGAEVAAAAKSARGPNWTAIAAGFSVLAVLGLAAWMMLGPTGSSDSSGDPAATPASGPAIGASGRPTIAVLPFRDRTGTEEMAWMAEGIPSMLVTGLAQTPGLDVVGNSRVQEIVARLGVENLQGNDAAALSDFAARSGAGAVVVGDLYYTGTEYRIDAQVEDVNTGRVLNAYSVTGPFIFGLVDDLVARIRIGLDVDTPESGERLADVTTDSLDAWRAYDEGLRLATNLRMPQALARFEEAIAIDPDFVLAKFQAARLGPQMADPAKAEEYHAFVQANIDRLSERDRPYVEADYLFDEEDFEGAWALLESLVARYPDHELAWLALQRAYSAGVLGFSEEQLESLERGVAAIPASGPLHNQLGYAYLDHGRYTEAVRAIERYLELNPEQVNPYDSLAEMYTVSGQPQLGFEKYTAALDVDPTWVVAYKGRAMTLGMMGRYAEAFDELEKYQEAMIAARPNQISDYPFLRGMMLAKP
ncbi:MAG: protein kinase, partial [Acidobacteria bacterium]|nr:protein kinase [Acidobacteriota bacterium]